VSDERIDLEDSHTPGDPRIRRIKRPDRQADVFRRLMTSDAILAQVRIPQPQPGVYGSIYDIQKALGNREFET
jgi:hypothetical protein